MTAAKMTNKKSSPDAGVIWLSVMPSTVPARPAKVPERNQVIVVTILVSIPLVMARVVLSDIARIDLPKRVVLSMRWIATMITIEMAITTIWSLFNKKGPMCLYSSSFMLYVR